MADLLLKSPNNNKRPTMDDESFFGEKVADSPFFFHLYPGLPSLLDRCYSSLFSFDPRFLFCFFLVKEYIF